MRKNWKRFFRTLVLIAVSLVVGVNVYLWNAQSLMGNALPMPFGYGAAVVLTGSMEPTIGADELIFVQAQDAYGVDDIVVYQNQSLLVVHRVIETDGDLVTTKGDANNAADTPVPVSQIKGRVIGHIPYVGAAVKLLKTPAATFALVAAAIWMAEASFQRERKQDDDELEKIKEEIRRLKAEQE